MVAWANFAILVCQALNARSAFLTNIQFISISPLLYNSMDYNNHRISH